MVSFILRALVLVLSSLGGSHVAAQEGSPGQNGVEKLFLPQPLSEVPAGFQKPAGTLAVPAAGFTPPGASNRPEAPSSSPFKRERQDTTVLPRVAKPADGVSSGEPPASTASIERTAPSQSRSSFFNLQFNTVDPARIFASPSKYQGKPLQVRGTQCVDTNNNELSCIANGDGFVLVIAGPAVDHPEMKRSARECAVVNVAMFSVKCRKTARFVLLRYESDKINVKRLTLFTNQIQLEADEPVRLRY